jgi:hypothetical protein
MQNESWHCMRKIAKDGISGNYLPLAYAQLAFFESDGLFPHHSRMWTHIVSLLDDLLCRMNLACTVYEVASTLRS